MMSAVISAGARHTLLALKGDIWAGGATRMDSLGTAPSWIAGHLAESGGT